MFGDYLGYVDGIMDHSAANRNVIANNVSNFNTPNFKTKALKFDQVIDNQMRLDLKTENNNHIKNSLGAMEIPKSSIEQESGNKTRVDGNNVDQTAEMIKMLKNNYVFNTGVNAIHKEFQLFRTAIGR